ncbi:OmpA family protein [Silanimonas sp.]|uniref:OmpA family protein n=1 Tax=Silanimonas sp. TaxID=1929290 RepID=UPI0022BD133D|nr:OmpA family protein [Silanimonas sp.]MCZ8063684.1 OmpA family protein [Silanimonas sp.]
MRLTLPTAIAAALSLAGSAFAADVALRPEGERTSDAAIHADHGAYAGVQQRIQALNEGGRPVRDYHLSKAQCWLDVSFHEYTRNDRSDFTQAALDESVKLVAAMEAQAEPLPMDTPLVNGAARLRPDLWERFGALKQHVGFRCAQQLVACGEVELVHAGNEYNQQQWRHAKPYVQIAEENLGEATAAAEACVPPPAPVRVERIVLNASALFRFDRSAEADLLPQGRAELDALAAKLGEAYASVESITLVGHTDRLGSEAYNDRLSQARADTVRAYLQGKGIAADITAIGRGEAEPVKECPGGDVATRALTECLQPNRRVEVTITGTPRERAAD